MGGGHAPRIGCRRPVLPRDGDRVAPRPWTSYRCTGSSGSTCRSAFSQTAGGTPTFSPGGRSAAAAPPCSRSRPGRSGSTRLRRGQPACRELTGKGLSAQTWGLRGKLLEADAYRRQSPPAPRGAAAAAGGNRRASPTRLYEVHPELAFAALAGAPLADSKHTEAGLVLRRDLLAQAGITLPPMVTGAPENDLLDAAAVAWSARRIAAGEAVTLTNPPSAPTTAPRSPSATNDLCQGVHAPPTAAAASDDPARRGEPATSHLGASYHRSRPVDRHQPTTGLCGDPTSAHSCHRTVLGPNLYAQPTDSSV